MPVARFQMPDGRIARFEVPEGTTPEQAQAMIGEQVQAAAPPGAPQPPGGTGSGAAANMLAGAVKGASNIGATLLTPIDWLARKAGVENSYIGRTDRRQAVTEALQGLGADPESVAYKAGQFGAEVAGTAGAGGAIAKGLRAVPAVARVAPSLVKAVESGGFMLGRPAATLGGKALDVAARTAGGAVVGGTAAGMVDPENAATGAAVGAAAPHALKVASVMGGVLRGLTRNALGASTGTGAEAVRTAYAAGKAGKAAFLDNIRGKADMTAVLDDAKTALGQIRAERAAAYREGMAQVSGDRSVLDMAPVLEAARRVQSMGAFKGVPINKNAAGTVQDVVETVTDWASRNPDDFHTAEGLDALKQALGDIRDGTQYGTAARRAVDQVYNAVKSEITKQAPTYAKTMRQYSEASDLIHEIERSLTGVERTPVDTAMRKLQSLVRNNVNTNYGNRLGLARELEARGADILPAVAGQAMSSATPRGLQGLAATGTGLYSLSNPAALAFLPAQSPRIVGEAAYGLGRLSGLLGGVVPQVTPAGARMGALLPALGAGYTQGGN